MFPNQMDATLRPHPMKMPHRRLEVGAEPKSAERREAKRARKMAHSLHARLIKGMD